MTSSSLMSFITYIYLSWEVTIKLEYDRMHVERHKLSHRKHARLPVQYTLHLLFSVIILKYTLTSTYSSAVEQFPFDACS